MTQVFLVFCFSPQDSLFITGIPLVFGRPSVGVRKRALSALCNHNTNKQLAMLARPSEGETDALGGEPMR